MFLVQIKCGAPEKGVKFCLRSPMADHVLPKKDHIWRTVWKSSQTWIWHFCRLQTGMLVFKESVEKNTDFVTLVLWFKQKLFSLPFGNISISNRTLWFSVLGSIWYILHPPSVREAMIRRRKFVRNNFGNNIYLILTGEMEQNECGGQSWAQQIILIVEYSWNFVLWCTYYNFYSSRVFGRLAFYENLWRSTSPIRYSLKLAVA